MGILMNHFSTKKSLKYLAKHAAMSHIIKR